ncbi:Protein-serine/threonine phosphatase [Heracleum sosnowskyi]|uniref:protein-serine/threonine phosphatase n=1 Tax=Heracleum sosnowskyi TaxID=360622 RepID=A0AAD8HDM2_9APIA|nr:Protein-serine/threonine phosphatase [Heracleum sosnowskyi]
MSEKCVVVKGGDGDGDVEEGEISDSCSVEEISAKDFSKGDESIVEPEKMMKTKDKEVVASASSNSTRVWTMQDLYKYQNNYHQTSNYQISNGYASGLYNIAWAQAVNNKPLNQYLITNNFRNTADNSNVNSLSSDDDDENVSKKKNNNSADNAGKEGAKVVIQVEDDDETEKGGMLEEGELEEGEIDLDSEADVLKDNRLGADDLEHGDVNCDNELEKQLNLISKDIQTLSLNDGDTLYAGVCSRLQNLVDSLRNVHLDVSIPQKDALIQKTFASIQTVKQVFFSMSQNLKEQNKAVLSRLFAHITSQKPPLFSSEQMAEIQAILPSLGSVVMSPSVADTVMGEEIQSGTINVSAHDTMSIDSPGQNDFHTLDMLKTEVANFKSRGAMLPLLDLHKDHDADSLPSPTRETPQLFPLEKALSYGNGEVRPEWPVPRPAIDTKIPVVQSYGTDALKAFSTYQQKFGRNTFLVTNRLPSPTPSEESDNGDGDTGGEISSSLTLPYVVNSPTLSQTIVSSIPQMDNSSGQGEVTNSRKQKIVQKPTLDGPAAKRQKNEQAAGNVETVSGHGGWLEDRGTAGLRVTGTDHSVDDKGSQPRNFENALVSSGTTSSTLCGRSMEPQHTPVNTTSSLTSFLKDIAVNPTLWMNIFKQTVEPEKVPSQPLGSDSVLGSLPKNVLPIIPTPEQRSDGALQAPQTASSDESGKLRMKPRDPRRVLQNNISHKVGNLESGQAKSKKSTVVEIVNHNVQKQDQVKSASTQSTEAPDIARLFTKNLKNIADIMSVSQTSTLPPAASQIPSSQAIQVRPSSVSSKGVLPGSSRLTGESGLPSAVTAGPSQSQNKWREVEHLFQGFDDKQKADIQKERARRLDEQNKMFAARKLCLVLDLDHTLLNSAKFTEIDPVHEELLRKKEEEDGEYPHRHLFRFPHMGMWTKLRPGIWNFLEKASKLFELHLYTMGNKVYATEMAKILDPKGVLFAGRVISKGDDGDISDGDDRVHKTKDLEGVLGMESAVVIIDDSVRVWPHNKLNLIVVERYIYFPCSRRQFGLPGPSLLESCVDETPECGSLASCLGVIERIHQNFFSSKSLDEADVRNILAAEQHKILDGCRILFSRVIPLGTNPHLHPLWQMAEQFGAVCTNQMDERVTHVVAYLTGTDKVTWAFNNGKFVVHPDWVEASALLYRRASEHNFAIKP